MKKIGIVIMILLLTGCTVDYKINIDKKIIEENVNILEDNINNFDKIAYDVKSFKETISFFSINPVATNFQEIDFTHLNVETNYEKYIIKTKKTKDKITSNYNYKFDYEKYKNSTMIYACYKNFSAILEDQTYYISTGKQNDCFNLFPLLDKIEITVNSYYEVVNSNADEFDKNTGVYKWHINKDEPNKQLSMTIDMSKKNSFRKGFLAYFNEYPFLIIFLGAVILIGIISIIVRIVKIRRNNEI